MVLTLVRTINVDSRGSNGTVETAEFSPDSQFVTTGSSDGKVRLFRVSDGALLWESTYWDGSLDDSDGEIEAVYFSADGSAIAAGGNSDGIKIYRASDGSLLSDLGGNGADGLAFSPNGAYFAGANRGRRANNPSDARMYNPTTWSLIYSNRILHNNEINSIDFTRDSQYVVTGSRDRTVQIRQAADGALVRKIQVSEDEGSVKSVRVSPNGELIAVANGTERVAKVFRFSDGALLATLPHEDLLLEAVAFSPDGRYLATGGGGSEELPVGANQGLRLYRTSDFALVAQFTEHTQGIEYIDFSPDGRSVVTASEDGTIKLWRFPLPAVAPIPIQTPTPTLTPTPDGTLTPSPGGDPTVPDAPCTPGVRRSGNNRANRLRGSQGCDVISGRGGADILIGLNGNDTMVGGAGDDRLHGDAGNDVLTGGVGVDLIWGGAGGDRFVYNSIREGGDRIRGFDSALDKLDLSRVIAGAGQPPGGLANYVRFRQVGANTVVSIDSNGSIGGAVFRSLVILERAVAGSLSASNVML
ncbi:type I secretion C-terminal target domain-containing protein [Oscillatoria sp. FACHB-1407]|uniref:WD40 domain-containing protein n=1 Tax=Oscillatoria sp. FACHB-1407 TaxID=2692847 RepID=UPI001688C00B|nr:type I secretion C-terminal target domain-containing protein [Oscillatoria sp. FACHB-1407]MBD2460260.1 type I secretion C-terminal target domain-containing protein [Oscillatoria sp. FACHB-1407]